MKEFICIKIFKFLVVNIQIETIVVLLLVQVVDLIVTVIMIDVIMREEMIIAKDLEINHEKDQEIGLGINLEIDLGQKMINIKEGKAFK